MVLLAVFAFGCIEDPEFGTDVRDASVPEVITLIDDEHPIQQLATSIIFQAEVTHAGGVPVERYGVCWGTTSNPVIESGDTSVCGSGTGEFTAIAKNLKPNTLYYIRPYATNSVGTSYGDEFQKNTTKGLGVMQTFVIDSLIRAESAVVGGNILDPGEGEILERGVYLTQKGTKITDTIPFTMEADSFYQRVTGLERLASYEVEAYLVNTFGTITGGVLSFTTTDGMPLVAEPDTVDISFTSATFSSKLLESGDSLITALGFCYGTEPNPTLENDFVTAELQADSTFSASLPDIVQQTRYYVRAFATNSYGTFYSDGSGATFVLKDQKPTVETEEPQVGIGGNVAFSGTILAEGMSPVTEAGFLWSTEEEPTLETPKSSHRNLFEEGATEYAMTLGNMRGGTTYYVRLYAKNEYGTSYGEVKAFETPRIFESRSSAPEAMQASSQALASYNSLGYLLGGSTQDSQLTDQFLRYNASADQWNKREPFPDRRKWQTLISYNSSSLWAFGGLDEDGQMNNDLYIYYTRDDLWRITEPTDGTKPAAVCNAMGITDNLNILIAGGRILTGSSERATDKVWAFNTLGASWAELSPLPKAIYDGIALEIDGRIFIGFGKTGTSVSGEPTYNTAWWSSPVMADGGITWTEETAFAGADGIRAACVFEGDIYVLDTDGYIWIYDTYDKEWDMKSQLPSDIRNASVLFALGNMIYVHAPSSKLTVAYDPTWDNTISWEE